MQKMLIAYYTWSGNTETVAREIQKQTGADIVPIEPLEAYPGGYSATVDQAKKEINKGHRPVLKNEIDTSAYDVVFVGSPNWWSTIAPPVATFLEQAGLTGKTVLPFFTHGGGGAAKLPRDTAALCIGADVKDSFVTYNAGGPALKQDVEAWLNNNGVS